MNNSENSFVVASFKDIKGDVIKTMCINDNKEFNENWVPEVATSYYLYSKKGDKYSVDASCQIGVSLEKVLNLDENEHRVFAQIVGKNYGYLVYDSHDYVVVLDDDMKLARNFDELVTSFQSDLENIKTVKRKRKM